MSLEKIYEALMDVKEETIKTRQEVTTLRTYIEMDVKPVVEHHKHLNWLGKSSVRVLSILAVISGLVFGVMRNL